MIKQIDWTCDKDVLICFDKVPVIQVQIIIPDMSESEYQDVIRYPFICITPLHVLIFDNKKFKQYEFDIEENYPFDGCTIPRFFWRIIGAKTDNQFLVAALIHDVLCQNHDYIDKDRKLSSKVFRSILTASGVGKIKAYIMYLAVDLYQKFFAERRKKWIKN